MRTDSVKSVLLHLTVKIAQLLIIATAAQPLCANIKVVKAICTSCENEIVVFDNRFHGYDSENTTKEELDYAPHFSEKS